MSDPIAYVNNQVLNWSVNLHSIAQSDREIRWLRKLKNAAYSNMENKHLIPRNMNIWSLNDQTERRISLSREKLANWLLLAIRRDLRAIHKKKGARWQWHLRISFMVTYSMQISVAQSPSVTLLRQLCTASAALSLQNFLAQEQSLRNRTTFLSFTSLL